MAKVAFNNDPVDYDKADIACNLSIAQSLISIAESLETIARKK
jgi:hypothetical protein